MVTKGVCLLPRVCALPVTKGDGYQGCVPVTKGDGYQGCVPVTKGVCLTCYQG